MRYERNPYLERACKWLLALGGLAGLLIVALPIDRAASLLVLRDLPTRTDAAIVFGGDPQFERTIHAARLFQEGLVSHLILCGGEPGPGDHATSLMQLAIESGVPAQKIILEEKSTSTRESVEFVLPLIEIHGIRSLTLVTSPYHQKRAFLTTRKLLGSNVTLINSPADPSFWNPEGWWRDWDSARVVLSEYGKLGYYFVRGWI